MKNLLTLILFMGCIMPCRFVNAQIQHPGRVMPFQYAGSKIIPVIDLSAVMERKAARAEEKPVTSRHKNQEFAYTVEVSYDYLNAGIWDTLENGWKIWRLGIRSEGAHSLNLIFTGYRLEKGVRLFLFDPAQQFTLGAYTYANNRPYDILAVEPVPGDIICIEMQVPPFIGNPGKLRIGVVGHDYSVSATGHKKKDGWYGLSGECNPDINCYDDSVYSLVKYAVVRIVYAGKERCTGVLLTNTRNDAKPYLLTAQHCIRTEWLANTAVYFFDYESPFCDGPDGSNHKSISGGTLKATTDNKLDFSLIELSENIPFYYHPYFAGWDATGLSTGSVFTIHHPWGDVKKIAIDTDQPLSDNFGEGYDFNTHWRVGEWETGTTEPGSSGAPLFSTAGTVIGSETGGDAYCENSVNDFFQQFSHAWDDYPDSSNQLRHWLDPFKSNIKTLRGYYPYKAFWLTGDTLTNVLPGENLTLSGEGLSWGYISGHNSNYIETIGERYIVNGRKYLMGVDMYISRAYTGNDDAIVNVTIWEGMDYNEGPVYQEAVPIIDFVADAEAFLEFDSAVMVRDTFMIGVGLFYPVPGDTFAVFHTTRDPGDHNTAFVIQDDQWISMEDPSVYNVSVSLALKPVVCDSIPVGPGDEPYVITDPLLLYPNPTSGGVWIAFKQPDNGEVTLKLFDITGHQIWTRKYSGIANLLYFSMDVEVQGAYFLQVITGQQIENQKIVLLK